MNWGYPLHLEPYRTFAGMGWGIQHNTQPTPSWVCIAVMANFQPSIIPLPQEHTSHWLSLPGSHTHIGFKYGFYTANSKIFSGFSLCLPSHLLVLAHSGTNFVNLMGMAVYTTSSENEKGQAEKVLKFRTKHNRLK